MKNKNNIFLLIYLLIIVILALSYLVIIQDTKDFRESPEGECLTKIAKDYCSDNKMFFVKVYSPWYDDSFACYNNRKDKEIEFHFTTKELRDCLQSKYNE